MGRERRRLPEEPRAERTPNRLILADNADAMRELLADEGEGTRFRLIYADPPFTTARRFDLADGTEVYRDRWPDGREGYLAWLAPRLSLMRDLLVPGGSLVVHLDHRVVHHAKVLLDGLFGPGGFRDEIVWKKSTNRGRRARARQFGRVTESLLWYTKGPGWTYHQPWRTRPIPLGPFGEPPPGIQRDAEGRYFKTAPRGDYTDESIARLAREGRIHRTRTGGVRIKYFLERRGHELLERIPVDNLWLDIPDKMHVPKEERLDFPTQKPEALLARIVEAMSDPGEWVGDFFCGSGTTLVAAERLGRRWVGVDVHPEAVRVAAERLRRTDVRPFRIEGLRM